MCILKSHCKTAVHNDIQKCHKEWTKMTDQEWNRGYPCYRLSAILKGKLKSFQHFL